jgi:hypothetical protein
VENRLSYLARKLYVKRMATPDAKNSVKNSKPWLIPHRWKPGQTGNQAGRPKKKPLTDAYARILKRQVPAEVVRKLGLRGHPTYAEMIAMALAKEAIKGKVQAASEMADRVEGRVSSPGDAADNPLHLQVEDVTDELIAALDRRADQRTPKA